VYKTRRAICIVNKYTHTHIDTRVITLRTKRFANASGNCCRKKKLTYYLVTNSRVGVGKKTHKHTHTCIVRQDNERALIADGWLRSNKPVKLQRFDHWHERCCNFIIPRLHNITGEIFLFFAQPSRVWFIILFSLVWPRNDGWPHCTVFFFTTSTIYTLLFLILLFNSIPICIRFTVYLVLSTRLILSPLAHVF